jgi:hypothetical protein
MDIMLHPQLAPPAQAENQHAVSVAIQSGRNRGRMRSARLRQCDLVLSVFLVPQNNARRAAQQAEFILGPREARDPVAIAPYALTSS